MVKLVGLQEEQAAIAALVAQAGKEGKPLRLWFQGPPGIGKTSEAQNIAERLAGNDMDVIELNGTDVTQAWVRDVLQGFLRLSAWGGKWKVCIVNEANAMTPGAVQALRSILDSMKGKRAIICTTNSEDDGNLWGEFTSRPILSRFNVFSFSLRGKGKEIAEFARAHMESRGMNGKAPELYLKTWVRAYNDKIGVRGYLARLEQNDWRTGRE